MIMIKLFECFLGDHIRNCGSHGKERTPYLPANSCNEFIIIMGQQVQKIIVTKIKSAGSL